MNKFSERAGERAQIQAEWSTKNREVRTGYFRLLVVGSGDAIHRSEVMPRPDRFRAVESGVVPASLSPGIGAFSIGGNS